MIRASFNINPCTTIISCDSLTNASDEKDILTFSNELSSLVRLTPDYNVPNIDEDMNGQIDKDENNKFCLHNLPNKNGEFRAKFSLEIRLACLNAKFQKKGEKLWTYTYTNNSKTVDK